ncbi:MAG: pyridoxal phosphate-dependent class II aminotransferase [Bacteroides sp.]|nr:pyridoxal phosphate-dependent class II aminotransferase [Roseburia sp.]MCM1346582.1 pyridoxal phosphate-dependent class II aminotransferase [Bacteroides sp.]MCM1421404.1 pyridoxal phosphate-dependent class II aminotransferase [Bacteroides sp.]
MLKGHGDDAYKYKDIRVNFSSNVYNHFDQEPLLCHLANRLDRIASYPEPEPYSLEKSVAAMLSLQKEEVCVTNGATEAIYLIAQTFRRSKTAVLMPAFSEYADACRLHEHEVCSFYSLHQLPKNAQTIWICNPNNPTGMVHDKEELQKSIAANEDKLFIIDQSYASFTLSPILTPYEASLYKNVILLHSMTKQFAIPGLRLGYMTGYKPLIEQIRRQRMPWSVNQVAIDAGHYLLAHEDDYRIELKSLMNERARMASALSALGFVEVWPSHTHILLGKLRIGKASALKDYLASEHGILIRDAGNFNGLDSSFFRIAVQTEKENNLLVEAIRKWIEIG